MKKKVLITGGTGLIGTALSKLLNDRGHEVILLSRKKGVHNGFQTYAWDYTREQIDPEATIGVWAIVHLAGAGIADKRWTAKRKEEIISSRVQTAKLLLNAVKTTGDTPKVFISASGINYYGSATTEHIFRESDPPSENFIGQCCVEWEAAADAFAPLCRIVKLRTGVVLSAEGGALAKMTAPVKLGLGAALGSGRQYMPWIHIDDLCQLYVECIEQPTYTGAYNAVCPAYTTNADLIRAIAAVLGKPLWLPNAPAFVLRLLLGELSEIVLEGSRASAQKLIDAGFGFRHTEIKTALDNLLASGSS